MSNFYLDFLLRLTACASYIVLWMAFSFWKKFENTERHEEKYSQDSWLHYPGLICITLHHRKDNVEVAFVIHWLSKVCCGSGIIEVGWDHCWLPVSIYFFEVQYLWWWELKWSNSQADVICLLQCISTSYLLLPES